MIHVFGISAKPMRDSISLYTMLALSVQFLKTQPAEAMKIAVLDNPILV